MSNQSENYRRAAETIKLRQFMLYKRTLNRILEFKKSDVKSTARVHGLTYERCLESALDSIFQACEDALAHKTKRYLLWRLRNEG